MLDFKTKFENLTEKTSDDHGTTILQVPRVGLLSGQIASFYR